MAKHNKTIRTIGTACFILTLVATGTWPLRQFLLLADLNLRQGKQFLRKLEESEQAKMKELLHKQTQLSTSRALAGETHAWCSVCAWSLHGLWHLSQHFFSLLQLDLILPGNGGMCTGMCSGDVQFHIYGSQNEAVKAKGRVWQTITRLLKKCSCFTRPKGSGLRFQKETFLHLYYLYHVISETLNWTVPTFAIMASMACKSQSQRLPSTWIRSLHQCKEAPHK